MSSIALMGLCSVLELIPLERGGGAFKVDALSGHDLYDEGAPTCSKVVVAEQNDFHQQMAASRRQINGGSYGK